MKTNKSVENVEVTPSKKKLTQARLPFKLISEDASTQVVQTRKRKLSADETAAAKIGKISKRTDLVEDLVVISDDDSKDNSKLEKEAKQMNPFVKLVDTAFKKKLQKGKSPKKRKSKRNSSKQLDEKRSEMDEAGDLEKMDVDMENYDKNNKDLSMRENTALETKTNSSVMSDVVVLEDSNNSFDFNHVNKKKTKQEKNNDLHLTEKVDHPVEPVKSKTPSKTEADAKITVSDENEEKSADNQKPEKPARKAKSDAKDKLNSSTSSAKLNESICSSPSTPKHTSRSSSVTNSLNDSITENSSGNLTPKQLQKKLESSKKREEREKERLEREKKRQEEKEERVRQRQEKEDVKRREREEKEEQKKKEREEKEKQKEIEKKLREEKEELKKKEREEKEEQRRKEKEEKEELRRKEKEAKEEEKRKKQEALELEKQEQEFKKKKAAEAFVNFFVPKQKEKDQPTAGPVSQNSILSSFTIKVDMRLAPIVRVELSDNQKLAMDKLVEQQKLKDGDLYLQNLKKNGTKIGTSGKTWPLSDKDDDDDVMIVEDELPPIDNTDEVITCESAVREKLRPKLLSFHENKRPPYWGTWRKKSAFVKPRKPFGQEKQVDYDVDSDEEWEEEQEGESLDGSAAGSDEEPEDEYEVDNEVFVPHGYLSDEEATMDEDDVLALSPETQKARLKNLEDEFESEMKKPTEKLKPRLYGLLWETNDGGKPEKCVDALWNYFGKLSMLMDDPTSLLKPPSEPQEPEKKKAKKKKNITEGDQQSPKSEKKKKPKPENKDTKKPKSEVKQPEVKKKQPGINTFLTKLNSSTT